MSKLLFISFFLCPLFSFGQKDSIQSENRMTTIDSIKQEINYINKLDDLSWKRYEIKNNFYIVYFRNDTLYRIKNDSRRLRANANNPIQGESTLELYFSSGKLTYGIVRCETPLNFSRPYSLEINYYLFKENRISSIFKEYQLHCECSDFDKIDVSDTRKLIKKVKKQIANKT